MPRRKIILATNEIYHIVSRSIAQMPIFKTNSDYQRLMETIDFYHYHHPSLSLSHYKRLSKEIREIFIQKLRKNKTSVDILAFCLMPTHCHFLLKQKQNQGISNFMRKLQDSYAKYFNTKYKRTGSLFQASFKAVRIETDEQLLHVSRYIHLNPTSGYLVEIKELEKYPWSSFPEYLNSKIRGFTKTSIILSFFKTREDYKTFVFNQADYQRKLQTLKHLTLEL